MVSFCFILKFAIVIPRFVVDFYLFCNFDKLVLCCNFCWVMDSC